MGVALVDDGPVTVRVGGSRTPPGGVRSRQTGVPWLTETGFVVAVGILID
jgi:hypothetical protein